MRWIVFLLLLLPADSQNNQDNSALSRTAITDPSDPNLKPTGQIRYGRLYKDSEVEENPPVYEMETENDEELDNSHDNTAAIVQNNYNVMDTIAQHRSGMEALIYISGGLLIAILLLGLVALSILIHKMLKDNELRHPMIVVPSPGGSKKWKHDPIYDIPNDYGAAFQEQPLGPPQYREHTD